MGQGGQPYCAPAPGRRPGDLHRAGQSRRLAQAHIGCRRGEFHGRAAQPKDQIFVIHDPRTFTALGEVWKNGRIPFGSNDVNLLESIALAGGGSDERIDAKGYFVFRYEEPEIVSDLLSPERFHELVAKGMRPNKEGRYPIVYRFDMSVADSLLVGQTFPIKNRDVIYASRHPAVDIAKFVRMVSAPLAAARTGQLIMNQ